MSAVPAVGAETFGGPASSLIQSSVLGQRVRASGGARAGVLADVVSLEEARRRLRGTAVEATIARHPAGKRLAATPRTRASFAAIVVRGVAWVLGAVLAFAIALGVGLALQPPAYAGETWTHSVTAGESVWGLAASLESTRPLEEVVSDIMEMNRLTGAVIHPGQELLLPAE